MATSNGDTNRIWRVGPDAVRGLGSFHKTLPHNVFGEVDPDAFAAFVSATRGDGREFAQVPQGAARPDTNGRPCAATFTNPQAGLAADRLTHHASSYRMPPAPRVASWTAAAEMVELYWMAAMRDVDLCSTTGSTPVGNYTVDDAVEEINEWFHKAQDEDSDTDGFILGTDVPGSRANFEPFTARTLFRLGFYGDEVGPLVSQFFLRPATFGTQQIDQRQRPYKAGKDYLTEFPDWLLAQNSGCDAAGQSYPKSNEDGPNRYETCERYISTMRDLARFVNKDALHQAYFNAALTLLSGGALWPLGNPYHNLHNGIVQGPLADREAGFGVLGGPHILALVSEVATRALKVVWRQKWQEHLRLRPEAYGGLVHVENIGVELSDSGNKEKRAYGLAAGIAGTKVAGLIRDRYNSLLLPMAFTAGSPTHPAYGAGHATVAGACVTILKACFLTFTTDIHGNDHIVRFDTLKERQEPYGPGGQITCWCTTDEKCPDAQPAGKKAPAGETPAVKIDNRTPLEQGSELLTIEGELNKLAQNVAMGRSMGGVHWRTDNTRSLMLGEALAAEILAHIATDVNERPSFTFRTFSRGDDGNPKKVLIQSGRIFVDGIEKALPISTL